MTTLIGIGAHAYSNPVMAGDSGITLGPELVTINADFAIDDTTDSGRTGEWEWVIGVKDWEITTGALRAKTSFTTAQYEGFLPTIGKSYRVIYTLVSGGLTNAVFGNETLNKAVGLNETDITAANTNPLTFLTDFSAASVIDNVSIMEIL